MGMNLEFLFEPCIKFKTIYENSFSYTFGCEKCKTSVNNSDYYCVKCGNKNDGYQKQSEYHFDFWELTNDELYSHEDDDYTYLFSNVKLDTDIELSQPIVLEPNYIEKALDCFKTRHKDNIDKVKEVAKDIEICFIVIKRWV